MSGPPPMHPQRDSDAPRGDHSGPSGLYRRAVAHVTVGIDFPFGYTITIWSAGALTAHDFGSPRPLDVAVFLGGAVLTYLLFGALSHPQSGDHTELRSRSGVALMNAVPLAPVALVAGIDALVSEPWVGWLLSGVVSTAAYVLALAALVSWHAARLQRRRGGELRDASR